jgi:CRISPR-associated protein Cas5t
MRVETIRLYVSVPVASFRVPRAREYFETFPVPPPATVYGMLLSMCGEVNRRTHEGAEIAIVLLSDPSYSVVLRTMWRVKKKEKGLGLGENRRPDFQELLTDVQLALWVRTGQLEKAAVPLATRIGTALRTPDRVDRFGGLSLGESTHLVDEVKELGDRVIKGRLLMAQDEGDLSLPIWPDHVGSNTRWGQYRLSDEADITNEVLDNEPAWTVIRRPALTSSTAN